MIARAHRFHGYNSLRNVYRHGQTVRGTQLSLKFLSGNSGRQYRVAVVVSRKVSKSAVVRNRIRRRIYEVVRQQKPAVVPGLDLVFTAFGDELATIDQQRLEAIIVSLTNKARQTITYTSGSPTRPRGIVETEGNT